MITVMIHNRPAQPGTDTRIKRMKTNLRRILIVLLISIVPSIDGFTETTRDANQEPEKPKTKMCCKMVLPKPEPGPWTIVNQIRIKVCEEVPVTEKCK